MIKLKQLEQYFQHHHPRLQEVSRKALLILSIIVLIGCRTISGYTSDEDINYWFYHFTITERISMLLLLLSTLKEVKKISWIFGELLFCILLQDIIDRIFFNFREININDYITIGLLFTIATIKYIKNDNRRTNRRSELL